MLVCCPTLCQKQTPSALGHLSVSEVRAIVTPSFEQVLTGEVPIEPWVPSTFLEFLRSEKNEENFFFYEEIEAFKAMKGRLDKPPSQEFLLLSGEVRDSPERYAKGIVEEFVKENSPNEVNISDHQRRGILENMAGALEAQGYEPEMFIEAQNEVKKLMLRDAWPRFFHKMMTENMSHEDSSYRLKEAIGIAIVTLVALGLMLGLHAPRWVVFVLLPLVYCFYEDIVTYKLSFCMRNAMKGLRDRFGTVTGKVPIACPVIQMKQKHRVFKVFALIIALTLITTGFFFSLTYIIEAGVGKTIY